MKRLGKNDVAMIILLLLVPVISAFIFAPNISSRVGSILLIALMVCDICVGTIFGLTKFRQIKKVLPSIAFGVVFFVMKMIVDYAVLIISTGIDGRPSDSLGLINRPGIALLVDSLITFVAMCLPAGGIFAIYSDTKKSIKT